MASNAEAKETRSCNAVINQNDKKYVKIMLTAPGLKVKRQMNLAKVPINCKILELEYKKHSVRVKFIINQGLLNETVYTYETDEDHLFNGPIQTEKSHVKYTENGIDIFARKAYDWTP